jgi:PAS domain S-box-containing protein
MEPTKPTEELERLRARVRELEAAEARRARAPQEARLSQEKFAKAFRAAPVWVVLSSLADGRYLEVNDAFLAATGYEAGEVVGKTSLELGTWAEPADRRRAVELIRSQGRVRNLEVVRRTKDGQRLTMLFSSEIITVGGRECLLSVSQDITQRKEAEEALRRSEELWRALVAELPAGVVVHAADGAVELANPAAHRLLGLEPGSMEGRALDGSWELLGEDGQPLDPGHYPVARVLAGGRQVVNQLVGVHLAGEPEARWFLVTAVPVAGPGGELRQVLVSYLDVSERQRAERERSRMQEQLLQVQKLESLGVLAGGVAHDFNNLLMGVMGNAGLALMELSGHHPARRRVEQVEATAKRLADLTGQLLAYSGKGRFVVRPLELSGLVEEMGDLLGTVVSKRAMLRYDLASDLPAVEGDPTQLRQVVMNLITNASDALGDRPGIITLATGLARADRGYLDSTWLAEELLPGDYVFLEVSDDGCGMDAATRSRIFDPFFTTKFTGRGLGLAAVLGIVRAHGGAIRIYSEPGRGTTIKVLLPASQLAAECGQEAADPPAAIRGRTILVVDDEPTVMEVARRILERHGCTVLTAPDGAGAVELYRRRRPEIDLVLLDMTMPGLGGVETFQELRRLEPGVRVVLSSGYNEQDATSRFAGKGLAGFIQKPYTPAGLVAKLGQVLEG